MGLHQIEANISDGSCNVGLFSSKDRYNYDHCAPKRGITNYDYIPIFRKTNMMIKTQYNHFEETEENYKLFLLPLYANLSTFCRFLREYSLLDLIVQVQMGVWACTVNFVLII